MCDAMKSPVLDAVTSLYSQRNPWILSLLSTFTNEAPLQHHAPLVPQAIYTSFGVWCNEVIRPAMESSTSEETCGSLLLSNWDSMFLVDTLSRDRHGMKRELDVKKIVLLTMQ